MKDQGFTLIELVVYIAIVSGILVLITGFLWNVIFGNIKESSYREVQQNARFALMRMAQEIRKATNINSPLPGGSDTSISLTMADATLDPTVFDISQGRLRITQGTSSPQEITTDSTIVKNIQFTNLSYPGTAGTVRIEIEIANSGLSNLPEYQASIGLKSTVNLLPGGATP
jgi:prepilin-type N-terminal cleavage/methylation domain-containing protein